MRSKFRFSGFGAAIAALTMLFPIAASAIPFRAISGLESITFWERSGGAGPSPFTFAVDGPELTVRLADPLGGASNFDIMGVTTEYYDVYYSGADGAFDLDGEYLSIEGVFLRELPAGGGLNLAEIELNFSSTPGEFGNFVASFVALGDNAAPNTADRAIDGDLQSHTTMGNTLNSDERLRVTLGFLSSSGPPPNGEPAPTPIPEPSAALLIGLGILAMASSGQPSHRVIQPSD